MQKRTKFMKKPYYLPISDLNESSVSLRVKRFAPGEGLQYHFHSEMEIQYVEKGRGQRMIGDVMEYFSEGVVQLIPAYVPHLWVFSGNPGSSAYVAKSYAIFFSPDMLNNVLSQVPELREDVEYLSHVKDAVEIKGRPAEEIGRIFRSMQRQDGFDRYISFLKILKIGRGAPEKRRIQVGHMLTENPRHMTKIQTVFSYLERNLDKSISLDDVASQVNMSTASFCKFFKKVTNQTFTEALNDMRVTTASMMLSNYPLMSISEIAYSVGYDSLSHFNHMFLKFKGETPSSYRAKFKDVSF